MIIHWHWPCTGLVTCSDEAAARERRAAAEALSKATEEMHDQAAAAKAARAAAAMELRRQELARTLAEQEEFTENERLDDLDMSNKVR